MGYVFVSYSRKDNEFVERLTNDLRQAGIKVWRDVDAILPGQEWASEIKSGVEQAEALLFVSSQNSVYSEWMSRELEFAIRNIKTVIPLVIDDEGSRNMPQSLYRIQWLDFRTNYRAAFERLITVLPDTLRQGQPVIQKSHNSKGYVFISYAQEDTAFVTQLRNFLQAKGYGYWDYQDSDRDYHTQLANELESVIREASATLSVLSPHWKRSKWAAKEFLFSEEVGTPVFLLMARKMEPTLVIAGIPYIDFTENAEIGFSKLDRELRRKGLIE
jgi:hypothetical protein